jgi:hypothetical protein
LCTRGKGKEREKHVKRPQERLEESEDEEQKGVVGTFVMVTIEKERRLHVQAYAHAAELWQETRKQNAFPAYEAYFSLVIWIGYPGESLLSSLLCTHTCTICFDE